MDGHKHRSSLDDPRHALRRLAHSPRLTLRRPPSTTSASSSASSIASQDTNDDLQFCAGRDGANDDCALNKFIVWAAVKRNACQKMTPEERRECPLLRCRKRFEDHEQMLKHLISCDELSAGEYWCYECAKVERFADAKPKKCPSHPSKRRKAITKARSFFSSLGHRTKSDNLIDLDPIEETYPPFNYEDDVSFSLIAPSPMQAELQSNEIHEIDSVELTPLPMIIEDEREGLEVPPPGPVMMTRQPTLPTYGLPMSPPTIHPTELECGTTSSALSRSPSLVQPPTIVPANLMNDMGDRAFERPFLQLHTAGLEQYRRKVKAAKSRSKYLGPSSSVRSTASTDSSNSTSTTASYAISPISAWSGAGWVRGNEFESTLTSPADEFAPCDSFELSQEPAEVFNYHFDDEFGVQFDDMITDPFLGQPLADLGMMAADTGITHPDTTMTPVDFSGADVSLFPLDSSGIPDLSPPLKVDETVPAIQVEHAMPQLSLGAGLCGEEGMMDGDEDEVCGMTNGSSPRRDHSARGERRRKAVAMTRNAYQALQQHITESASRIKHIQNSVIVDKLRRMTPNAVFLVGLDAFTNMLDGSIISSPSGLLCFVHLAYSLSFVMHEEDSLMRGNKLFMQAVSYAAWLTKENRKPYLAIVDLLWKPGAMSDDVVAELMRCASSTSRSMYSDVGKLMDQSYDVTRDSLAGVVQLFLDELEHTMTNKPGGLDGHGCDLHGREWPSVDVAFYESPSLKNAVDRLQQTLLQRYDHQPGFVDGLKQLFGQLGEGCQSTLRQFELGLLRVGKATLPSDTFTETYAPQIRRHIDAAYAQAGIQSTPRSVYYQHGVKLVRCIVEEETSKRNNVRTVQSGPVPSLDAPDNLDMMPQMTGFDISPISNLDKSSPCGLDVTDDAARNSRAATLDALPTPVTACTTAATTPPSPGLANTNSVVGAGVKVESDSCCELCGYRPEGDPRWFPGSMAKHKKLQHGTSPPKIYRCPYPGCTSQYRNRPDNLRQHQLKKGHFVDGDEEIASRPPKRKKMES